MAIKLSGAGGKSIGIGTTIQPTTVSPVTTPAPTTVLPARSTTVMPTTQAPQPSTGGSFGGSTGSGSTGDFNGYTGTSANGQTYTIGSDAGMAFINTAGAGKTMTGGDGSRWTKNADGTTTIVKNGTTYTVGTPTNNAATNQSAYWPTAPGKNDPIPSYFAGRDNYLTGKTIAPDNKTTVDMHNWAKDTTDYSALMANAGTLNEFLQYAQDRVHKANAQGIDIMSGTNGIRTNEQIYNDWITTHYDQGQRRADYIINGVEGSGYYGMDGSGHWGYYDDPGLTQKSATGGWDRYKASDGGYALFDTKNGYLWPSNVQDTSRAGKTVTLAVGSKAYEVSYNDKGYIDRVVNLTSTRGINGDDLNLPMAKSLNDQGVGGGDLLRLETGSNYAGPGSAVTSTRPGTRDDYNAIMALRGGTGGNPVATGQSGGNDGDSTAFDDYSGYYPGSGYYSGGVTPYPSGSNPGGTEDPPPPSGYPSDLYDGDGAIWGNTNPNGQGESGEKGSELADELKRLYDEQNSRYQAMLEEQRRAKEAAVARAVNTLEGQRATANQSYADLFRQLYIDRMNNQKNIDQRMAAQGVTGGAAESALLGLGTQYEDALRQGEQSRINTIDSIDRAITDTRLNGDISIAEQTANLTQQNIDNYANVLRSLIAQQNADRAYNYQLSRDAIGDQRYNSEWAHKLDTDAWSQQFSEKQLAQQLAIQQAQLAYQQSQAAAQMAYQQQQAAYQQQQAAQQWAYQQQQDEYERLLNLANLGAKYGDYSGLNSLGIDTSAYADALTAAQNKPTLTAAQVNAAIADSNLSPSVLSAYEYYYGVPYGSGSGAYTAVSANGKTYTIGSDMGISFVSKAKPGATLSGRDGSQWVKNADGSTTITKNGTTYVVQ